MTRYDLLLDYYHNLDTVTTGLVMIAVWAAFTGHLVDFITAREGWRFMVPVYWSLVITIYVIGIIFVGLTFSS